MQSAHVDEEQHSLQHGAKWMHSLLSSVKPLGCAFLCLGQQQCLARPPTSIPSISKGLLSSPLGVSFICHGGFQAIGKPAL